MHDCRPFLVILRLGDADLGEVLLRQGILCSLAQGTSRTLLSLQLAAGTVQLQTSAQQRSIPNPELQTPEVMKDVYKCGQHPSSMSKIAGRTSNQCSLWSVCWTLKKEKLKKQVCRQFFQSSTIRAYRSVGRTPKLQIPNTEPESKQPTLHSEVWNRPLATVAGRTQ